MKRHPSLVPLSHDHHEALVRARTLREAAEAGDTAAAGDFLAFFAAETARHFREEEEQVFPLLLAAGGDPPPEVVQALVEHGRMRALADRLRTRPDPETMLELATILHDHVRLEERVVFELVQERVADEELARLRLGPRELLSGEGPGPVWRMECEDLNGTVIVWRPGEGSPYHANDERDVLLVVLDGDARVTLEGDVKAVRAGEAIVLPKGYRRQIDAGGRGVRYLALHLRRGGLQIERRGGEG